MERKEWLTLVYREANLFLEQHGKSGMSPEELEEHEPELHQQIQEVLRTCDHLEDLIKFSLLRNPPPDLWYGEGSWPGVLASVASACLLHDVQGVILKILSGELPAIPSGTIHQKMEGT